MSFKNGLKFVTFISLLSGCSLSSDDKENITNNMLEPKVAQETQNLNLNASSKQFSSKLIGRAILNSESPEGSAEIVAVQNKFKRVFAINSSGKVATVDIISLTDLKDEDMDSNDNNVVTSTNLSTSLSMNINNHVVGDANSLSISPDQSLLAIAMAAPSKAQVGQIAFYDISLQTPRFIKSVQVGYLPDMVTFNHSGNKVLIANEGEPVSDYSVDPEGSISIIEIKDNIIADSAIHLDFKAYNTRQFELEQQGVMFANPTGRVIKGKTIQTTVAMDLEPEYISVSKNDEFAFVSLQENNALAIVDLSNYTVSIQGLGFKSWENLYLDASDKDGGINFKRYPGLYGMYQPDTIASYIWENSHFVVTANEGDGREYFFESTDESTCLQEGGLEYDSEDGCLAYTDEIRTKDLTLADNFSYLNNDNDDIGRLKVSLEKGDLDNDGRFEKLYTYGARSFSIWDQNGTLIFDSGDQIAKLTASIHGEAFNNDEDENKGDTRSDAKGAEPEALALGEINNRTYAFIGLERMGGIVVYDITNPFDVSLIDYFYNRGLQEKAEISGDLAPEGMAFISPSNSPTGKPLLVIGNEVSGSISVWQIDAL